jgi:predicted ribonuclease YlaK
VTEHLAVLDGLYDASGGNPVYAPDTNALLHHPDLDRWRFEGVKRFTIVLTPAVLGELDRLKVEHRNADVREGRGADQAHQVLALPRRPLGRCRPRRNISELKSIAVEPRVQEALLWLDPDNTDDRLIAAVIEVMRQNPRAPVILVTRDINAQNKAAYAGLPFQEPPEP